MPAESAIVVPVPAAEAAVAQLRWQHDPVARRGVPAHVTLLYPFAPPDCVEREIPVLADLFGSFEPFDFVLAEVRRFPSASYLHPDPPEQFLELMERLFRRWSEFPPYCGAFALQVPHVTVANQVGEGVLRAVEEELAPLLPIRARACAAWLMCSDDAGMWSRRAVLTLGTDLEC